MRLLVLALLCVSWCAAAERTKNRDGAYRPCMAGSELLKYESVDLGVRFATSNKFLAAEFRAALDFWSTVIDMRWHVNHTDTCAVELLDGPPELFEDSTVAKSHLAGKSGFQSWIAFNLKAPLTREELYLTAIHEIGHLLGLSHNPDIFSVMYYTNRDDSDLLDEADLLSLAARHKLRGTRNAPIRCFNSENSGESSMAAFSSLRHRLFSVLH